MYIIYTHARDRNCHIKVRYVKTVLCAFYKNCRTVVFFSRLDVDENVPKEFGECRLRRNNLNCKCPTVMFHKFCNRSRAEQPTPHKLWVYCFRRRPRASNRIDVMKFSSLDFFDRILAYSLRKDVERLSRASKT